MTKLQAGGTLRVVFLLLAALQGSCWRADPQKLLAEGQKLMAQKRYAEALDPLGRAFAADGSLVAAGLALAEVQVQEERFSEALGTCARLDRALGSPENAGADPDSLKRRAKASFLAARAHRELGQLSEAEKRALESLRALPRNPASRSLLGAILARQGRNAEAIPHLEEALETFSTVGARHGEEQVRYQLGQCFLALGKRDAAEQHLQRHRELKAESDRKGEGEVAAEYERLAAERAASGAAEAPPPTGPGTISAGKEGDLFRDRAAELGLVRAHNSGARGLHHTFETVGGGAAWIDYDLDGDPDLYLVSGQPAGPTGEFPGEGRNLLLRNEKGRYADVTAAARVPGRGYGLGALVGDVDSDGDPDLHVLCFGPNVLYRNRGDGAFEEISPSGLEGSDPFTCGAAFADFNLDGALDLFESTYHRYDPAHPPRCFERSQATGKVIPIYCGPVSYEGRACHVYRGQGDGRFRDVSRESGVGQGPDARSKGLGVLAADVDADGDCDVYVACDTTANLLYLNRGDGAFTEVGLEAGVAVNDAGLYEGSMGIAAGDATGDGSLDLFVTNFAEEPNRLYQGVGGGAFVDGTARTGLGLGSRPLVGWGAAFLDVGCDGRLDLLVANGHIYDNAEEWLPGRTYRQRLLLYRPEGERYAEVGEAAGAALTRPGAYRGLAVADDDLDGDLDALVIELDAPPHLLRAEGAHGNWLAVELEGAGPGGRDAVGARVEIVTRSGRQWRWRTSGGSYLSSSEARLHFGLGSDERVDVLTVHWPGRERKSRIEALPVNQVVRVKAGQ